jgi:hypothetical protein
MNRANSVLLEQEPCINSIVCTVCSTHILVRSMYTHVYRTGVQIMGGVWSFPRPQWRHRAWWWQVHARA